MPPQITVKKLTKERTADAARIQQLEKTGVCVWGGGMELLAIRLTTLKSCNHRFVSTEWHTSGVPNTILEIQRLKCPIELFCMTEMKCRLLYKSRYLYYFRDLRNGTKIMSHSEGL